MLKKRQDQARVWAIAFVLAAAMGQNAAQAKEGMSGFFGRWTAPASEKYSASGKLYKVIDMVACGKDLCGISVDGGACGATLFRVPGADVVAGGGFGGQGKWGAGTKLLVAQVMGDISDSDLEIELGDKESRLGSRSSMPTFAADYQKTGKASCTGAAPSA